MPINTNTRNIDEKANTLERRLYGTSLESLYALNWDKAIEIARLRAGNET